MVRRTLTGSALILSVAGLLWWASGSADGRPILIAAALVLIGAAWETSRMGSLSLRDRLPALLVPAIGVLLLYLAESQVQNRSPSALLPTSAAYRPGLAVAYVWTAALAASAHALLQFLLRTLRGAALARTLVYVVLGGIAITATRSPIENGEIGRDLGFALVALAVLLATCLPSVLRQPSGWRGLSIAVGLAVWLVPPLPLLWQVWHAWSTGGLVALLLCAKIGDTAGYYVGSAIGKHHPFPNISPGKTWEGCLGSFAAGSAAGGFAVAIGILPGGGAAGGIASGLAAGAVVNLAAQSGDLLESWVKRRAGVKDSSSVFGPSGGLLDQIDSLLLAVPVALATWPWILGRGPGAH